jgi:cytochrome c biogenesis protein CcmG, thiol:disulfide interchange protein DsbE
MLLRAAQGLAVAAVIGLLALLIWRIVDVGRGSHLVSEITTHKAPSAPDFNLKVIWARTETWPRALLRSAAAGHIRLSELRGHPVILNFFASWCSGCKTEAPLLAAWPQAHAAQVVVLGVDVQDFSADARSFLDRHHAEYVAVHDNSGATYDGYGLTGVPETYFIDRRGRILAHTAGPISQQQLNDGLGLIARRRA